MKGVYRVKLSSSKAGPQKSSIFERWTNYIKPKKFKVRPLAISVRVRMIQFLYGGDSLNVRIQLQVFFFFFGGGGGVIFLTGDSFKEWFKGCLG